MWKQFIKEYLSFTNKERRGIFILVGFIVSCLLIPFLFPFFIQDKKYDAKDFEKEVAKLKMLQEDSTIAFADLHGRNNTQDYTPYYDPPGKNYYSKIKGELFYFDPNTAAVADWKRLGVREKTAQTIQKYISKGGHFYKPEDIKRIWGLHPDEVSRLLPYVRIESTKKEYVTNEPQNNKNKPVYNREKKAAEIIDINSSDTATLISLPGIGNKLAQRIIAFRDKLGGFHSIDQVKETYGLPDSVFQKIKSQLALSNPVVKKLNLNTASLEEMRSHPYIRYNLANAFIQYRNQHGNYAAVADIKKIMIITDEIFKKVAPYLTVEQ